MNFSNSINKFTYYKRPWMLESGAASTAPSNVEIKGIIAGGISGAVEISVTFPTDYVKTQLQLDERKGQRRYNGVIDCVKKTIKKQGFFGLYRGLSIPLCGNVPKGGVRFGSYELFRKKLAKEDGSLSTLSSLICGLGAGCMEAIFVVTPVETFKVQIINDRASANPRFRGLFHGMGIILKEQGFHGLYKGVTPTILRQGSNMAIRFLVMNTLKDYYKGGDSEKKIPKVVIAAFGSVAGAVSVLGNTPLDVIKTRMQGLESSKYQNTMDCFRQILKKEGFFGFYKGTVPRLGKVSMDVAITFTAYETITEFFNKYWL